MPRGKPSKAELLGQYLDEARPPVIDEAQRERIAARLAPVAPRTLRRLLLDCGWPLAPLVEEVRQESFEALARTLVGLEAEYRAGTPERRKACREAVIRAKDHARFAARRGEKVRAGKEEMILWMRTWLENPLVFPPWLEIRRRVRDNREHDPNHSLD